MIPVTQTIFDDDHGNCLQACVASLLERPLSEVPNFMGDGNEWVVRLDNYLRQHGLYHFALDMAGDWQPQGYCILVGKSPRGSMYHAVVCHDGRIVHDPHPDGKGLRTQEYVIVFAARLETAVNEVDDGE